MSAFGGLALPERSSSRPADGPLLIGVGWGSVVAPANPAPFLSNFSAFHRDRSESDKKQVGLDFE